MAFQRKAARCVWTCLVWIVLCCTANQRVRCSLLIKWLDQILPRCVCVCVCVRARTCIHTYVHVCAIHKWAFGVYCSFLLLLILYNIRKMYFCLLVVLSLTVVWRDIMAPFLHSKWQVLFVILCTVIYNCTWLNTAQPHIVILAEWNGCFGLLWQI